MYADPVKRKEYDKAYKQRDYVKVRRRVAEAKSGINKAYRQRDYVKIRSNENSSKRRTLEIKTSKFELNNDDNILKLFKLSQKKTKETGRKYHVDHIVPLQGRLVTGFHVFGNLRVILAHTNNVKKNRYTARDEALIQRRMVKTWIANGVKFKLSKPKKKRKVA
tara:strand:+ start:261 stop:752 length:492 start_codon:yes stop_codon:yes gene_type:complete